MEYTIEDLIENADTMSAEINGKWVPCRPTGYRGFLGFRKRIANAWKVITGKADIVTWPKGQ